MPNAGHPSYGVLRAYVKDADDAPTTAGAQTWLDSGALCSFSWGGRTLGDPGGHAVVHRWRALTVQEAPPPARRRHRGVQRPARACRCPGAV